MPRYAFAIDNRKCIGCHACTVACKSEHDVPIGVNRTWVKYIEKGVFPDTRRYFSVQRCNHCADAPCVEICPVTSLYTRPDGIVDFDSDRCIGCKACMQACPYDALYIDPSTLTAAKCNYCTHRVDAGYEPACVVVCPVEAIVSGDLDDPTSPISLLDRMQRVQYPKVEKGTQPKLFYVGGETAAMDPAQAPPRREYIWSDTGKGMPGELLDQADREAQDEARARRVYDVGPKQTGWGWMVSAYVTTKAIAAGTVIASFLAWWRGYSDRVLPGAAFLTSLIFLAITGALLVGDLKQPRRFLYVLLRPQWRSWLVRGAYLILLFSLLLPVCWIVSALDAAPGVQMTFGVATSLAATAMAAYTAFLFAQAKGRDYWQNPLLVLSMPADAVVAGIVVLAILAEMGVAAPGHDVLSRWLAYGILALGGLLLAEFVPVHATKNAEIAARLITHGIYRVPFWGGVVLLGLIAPAILSLMGAPPLWPALFVAAGMAIKAHVLVQAPQRIPLS